MTTIAIVDDNPRFRRQLRVLLEADGLRVVGEAGSVTAAKEIFAATRPEIAVVDVGLPDGDGFQVAAAVAAGGRGKPAIVLTSSRDASTYAVQLSEWRLPFLPKDQLSAGAIRDAVAAVRDAPATPPTLGSGALRA